VAAVDQRGDGHDQCDVRWRGPQFDGSELRAASEVEAGHQRHFQYAQTLLGRLCAEYQGEPSDEEATIREEWLSENYWQGGDLDGVEMEAVAEGYDPSTGTTTDGSYGAIVKVARCPRGHFWVMDAWIKRRSVKRQVQALVEAGKLTAGHARALLRLEDSPGLLQVLARRMSARKISVRQAEEMVERKLPGAKKQRVIPKPSDPNIQAAQEAMERALGTRVRVVERRGGQGKVEIYYYNVEDLNRIYDKITK